VLFLAELFAEGEELIVVRNLFTVFLIGRIELPPLPVDVLLVQNENQYSHVIRNKVILKLYVALVLPRGDQTLMMGSTVSVSVFTGY
jgi:hypothetical protein